MNAHAEGLKGMSAELIADVVLYPTARGGRRTAALPGWGCLCMVQKDAPFVGYDGWPLLGDTPIGPGERRRLGFVFLNPEGATAMQETGKFYLWEGHVIGEATVVNDAAPRPVA